MGIITGIDILRNDAEIYVDGRLFLKLKRRDFEARPLEVGDEVDEEEYVGRICAGQAGRAREAALSALDRRDLTEREMVLVLTRQGYMREVAESAAARLAESGLIDDSRYAHRFVELRAARGEGKYALRTKLRAKGIDPGIIDAALEAGLDDSAQISAARQLALKYLARYEGKPEREARAKTAQALARKGYSWEIIERAMEGEGE